MPHPIELIIIPIVAALASIGVGLYYLLSKDDPQTEYNRARLSEFVDNANTCKICSKRIRDDVIILKCDHRFHTACINLWRHRGDTCPICKENI